MPDPGRRNSRKYEAPVLFPLGELAKGTGACALGSLVNAQGNCLGGSVAINKTCNHGGVAGKNKCGAGTTAV